MELEPYMPAKGRAKVIIENAEESLALQYAMTPRKFGAFLLYQLRARHNDQHDIMSGAFGFPIVIMLPEKYLQHAGESLREANGYGALHNNFTATSSHIQFKIVQYFEAARQAE